MHKKDFPAPQQLAARQRDGDPGDEDETGRGLDRVVHEAAGSVHVNSSSVEDCEVLGENQNKNHLHDNGHAARCRKDEGTMCTWMSEKERTNPTRSAGRVPRRLPPAAAAKAMDVAFVACQWRQRESCWGTPVRVCQNLTRHRQHN